MTSAIVFSIQPVSVDNLSRGESMVYHTGFLAIDRIGQNGKQVANIANTAMELAQAGRVILTQRRRKDLGWSIFDYVATGW